MRSPSAPGPEIRRARPLLGTIVEITAPATPSGEAAVCRAFAGIARVHGLMSAHDPASDLGRIASARAGAVVPIHPWTWRVLATAQRLARDSAGTFDPVAVGSAGRANWHHLRLLPNRRAVRCVRRLRVDLGGIAKGFAVDQAIRSLRRADLPWGLVNAGGDLRGFGARAWPLHVRHAAAPGELCPLPPLVNLAAATSAPYFSRYRAGAHDRSALLDPRTRHAITGHISATVFARTALLADALTKIVLLLPPAAATALLSRYRARAQLHTANAAPLHPCKLKTCA